MSPAARLKRALVKLLLAIAREFSIILSINRDSSDAQIKTAYKKVLVRVHPDKPGGSAALFRDTRAAADKLGTALTDLLLRYPQLEVDNANGQVSAGT